jgi:phosphoglycerate kinase
LRFNEGEEKNDIEFSKQISHLGDVYINEAFGVSHRDHASVTGIPEILPSFFGLNFENEIKVLGELRDLGDSKRPLVFVLGGSKKDKLDYLEFLGEWCDKVLVGGKLPLEIKNQKSKIKNEDKDFSIISNFKFQISNLTNNGKDIDDGSIKKFVEIIKTAETIIWAGPMGVYEEEENKKGTFEIAKAISESKGYKVAGGGDTHRVLGWLNLWNKFDFISSGGGAMLSFLKNKTLVGIEAICNKN